MIRRLALAALGRAITEGIPASTALRGHDPTLALLARRRIARALSAARRATDIDDEKHRLRLAWLQLARGGSRAAADDASAVAYEQSLAAARLGPPPGRLPWLTALLVLAVAGGGAALALRAPRPPVFDARETPAGRVLGAALTSYLVAAAPGADPAEAARRDQARAAVTGPGARAALGDEAAHHLAASLDAFSPIAGRRPVEHLEPLALPLREEVHRLDRALAARGLPYFVDATIVGLPAGATPLLLSYYVEREREATTDEGARVRALHLWRLDTLNLAPAFLGYTHPDLAEALVLLDQTEAELVTFILPALPPGERMALLDDGEHGANSTWIDALERRAAEVARSAWADPRDPRTGDLVRVGERLARRRALITGWRRRFARSGLVLHVPERLVPEADYVHGVRLYAPDAELREWEDIHEALVAPDHLAPFLDARDRHVSGIERHEVQHRLDAARNYPLFRIPIERYFTIPGGSTSSLPPMSPPVRVHDETSAYLAQIARPDTDPRLDVVLLGRHTLHSAGGVYAATAHIVVIGLGEELGLDATAARAVPFDRPAVARLLAQILDRSPDDVHAAAEALYRRWFGRLARVTTRTVRDHPPWRH